MRVLSDLAAKDALDMHATNPAGQVCNSVNELFSARVEHAVVDRTALIHPVRDRPTSSWRWSGTSTTRTTS